MYGLLYQHSVHYWVFTVFLIFGRKARIPDDILCGTSLSDNMKVDDYVAQQCRILEEAYRQVCHTVGLKQDHQKELYDCRRHGEPFQDGDL